ncbi:MAG: transcription antitermination factor NusB [Paracoccaceae bacterium]
MTGTDTSDTPRPDRRTLSSAARLYAVQALFQMEAAGQSADRVTREFQSYRIDADDRDGQTSAADEVLCARFRDVVGVGQSRSAQPTARGLGARWPISRIDPVLRALFRAAGAELVAAKAPPKVVISEYVRLAEAFFPDGKEPKFVNAVLDHVARELRADAF